MDSHTKHSNQNKGNDSFSNQSENRIIGTRNLFPRIMVTIAIALVVVCPILFVYLHINKPPEIPVVPKDSAVVVAPIPVDSITPEKQSFGQSQTNVNPSPNGMVIVTDDPAEPPYGMMGIIYNNRQKLLTFGLPDGGFTEDNNDSTLSMTMPVDEETNLASSVFIVTLRSGECITEDPETDSSTLKTDSAVLIKSEFHDAGAGQYYDSYTYSLEKNGTCITFSLQLQSSNAQFFDPPVKEFDLSQQIKKMETILSTIKLF